MEAAIAEIKPNIKKAFVINLLVVGFIVVAIILFLVYLDNAVGLDIFLDTFREVGVNLSPSYLLSRFIFLILFFTALLLILNYVALGKTSYTLYPDKMVYSKSFFIMQISGKTISYANIAKIFYENKFFLNTARITIGLTGMKKPKIELDFIDNAREVVGKIQELVRDYKANYYARYSQGYRYQTVMDKY